MKHIYNIIYIFQNGNLGLIRSLPQINQILANSKFIQCQNSRVKYMLWHLFILAYSLSNLGFRLLIIKTYLQLVFY